MDWTVADVPDQTGRTALITGGNTGLGYETAQVLAHKGARVVLACRNPGKAEAAAEAIGALAPAGEVEVLALDLGDLDLVRGAAREVRDRFTSLDLLVNNAGVMAPPREETADGFELQFGTNHLGHFAFTGLLLDLLVSTPESRVVTVSSLAHQHGWMRWDDLQRERRYVRMLAYGQSKLANLLFTFELQRRLAAAGHSTEALASHPGLSNTELNRHLWGYRFAPVKTVVDAFFGVVAQDAAIGALPSLRAATDPEARGGEYYGPGGFMESRGYPTRARSNRRSRDESDAARLWELSEDLTDVSYL